MLLGTVREDIVCFLTHSLHTVGKLCVKNGLEKPPSPPAWAALDRGGHSVPARRGWVTPGPELGEALLSLHREKCSVRQPRSFP